jgi:hypothetical protein
MSPIDTITDAAVRSPRGFALSVSGVSLTVLIAVGAFMWDFSAKQALARHADSTHTRILGTHESRLDIVEDEAHDNERTLEYISKQLDTNQKMLESIVNRMNNGD